MIIARNTSTELVYQKPAIFLDRDGVINEEVGYISRLEDLHVYSFVRNAISRIHAKGFYAIIVSNQSGVARGIINIRVLKDLNDFLIKELGVDAIYCCPHHAEGPLEEYKINCECRKPKIGMIEKACADYSINIKKSYMVGDRAGDILTGKNAGLKTVLVNTGYGVGRMEFFVEPDFLFNDLGDFANSLKE